MRARHPVLISFCVSVLSICAACTDTVGPANDITQPALPVVVQTVTLSPAQATLSAGAHVVMTATPVDPSGKPVSTRITWSSSDQKIATVSDSGDVVAVAPGNAVITANANGAYATAAVVVVQQEATDSATVAPQKADVAVGQTVQFSVMTRGQKATDGVTWASSNAQVASVSSSGLVTGVAAGIASIRATYVGQTSIATVTVVMPSTPPIEPTPAEPPDSAGPSAPGSWWSEQPAGLATITDQSWTTIPSLGWQVYTNGYDHVHAVADPTVPTGDPKVLEFEYPAGYSGGGYGPAQVTYELSARELYIGFFWKLSPNWQGHSTGVNKLFYVFQRLTSDDRQAIFLAARGSVNGPFRLAISNEPDGGAWFTQNVNNVTLQAGQWYKIELHLKRSSSDGAPDGLVEWWVDGKLAARYANAKLRDEPFSEVHIDPVWGGNDPSIKKLHDDYERFGHIHVSGR